VKLREDNETLGVTLGELDRDGAVLEAIDGLYGSTRADFLRSAVVGGSVLLTALAAPPAADARELSDVGILNFDLTFEHLQATFYTEAERIGTIRRMSREKAVWAQTLGAHERAHVKILRSVLGKKAGKKPTFDFRGATDTEDEFVKTAVAMEDLTVTLLAGQAPRLRSRQLVAAVFSLLTVEARHAAWARHIVGVQPVGKAFDEAKSIEEVGRLVDRTRFIASRPRTAASGRRPRFTG
jgi:rubrerythrin